MSPISKTSIEALLRRRALLKLLGGSALAALLPACGSSEPVMDAASDDDDITGDVTRVIIIGAGFAGLTAANALTNAGVDCVVLEARDRMGGRILTADVGGSAIDLGASWIHGPIGNPMSDFANKARIAHTPADPTDDVATIRVYDANVGRALLLDDVAKALVDDQKFNNQEAALLAALGPQSSLKEGVELFLDRNQPDGEARRRAEFTIRLLTETFESGPWQDISFEYEVNSPVDLYQGSDVGDFPVGGYHGLIEAMAHGAAIDIRLRHRVTRVVRDAGGVRVDVLADVDGNVAAQTLSGSHVLVTVPLGVLKAGDISFVPELPVSKLGAIQRVGFGIFEKIAMRFPYPFWETAGGTHLVYLNSNDLLEWPLFLDLQRLSGEPAMIGLCTAKFAASLAAKSDAEIQARVMAIFSQVYGNSIPAPQAVRLSRWKLDEFTRGSYSYLAVGSTPADMDELARPVEGRLLFAGEHSYVKRYGYADGALSSGLREARRLLRTSSVTVTAG